MNGATVGSKMGEYSTVAERVVQIIAAEKGLSPVELEPLHDVVDPDALNALFESVSGNTRTSGQVSFHYHGYTVTISANGQIDLTEGE
ncbi:HalOD1 output domain-containing protein [Halorientalis brevis]|uniref:HalOD1 output domain-containing protein n=1 Tax=Halorientalis brevis TaxID=1126241 RepID=A0ABD6CBY4_9EURY